MLLLRSATVILELGHVFLLVQKRLYTAGCVLILFFFLLLDASPTQFGHFVGIINIYIYLGWTFVVMYLWPQIFSTLFN